MFSKALFKQSIKAHWIKWLCVTISTCVMLAIVIIVLGNLGINDIRDSLKNVFVQANEESYLKENSVDSYELYLTAISNYNEASSFSSYTSILTNEYNEKVNAYVTENGEQPSDEIKNGYILEIAQKYSAMAGLLQQDPEELKTMIIGLLTYYKNNPELTGEQLFNNFFVYEIYNQAYAQVYEEEINKGSSEEDAVLTAKVQAESAKQVATGAVTKYNEDKQSAGESFNFNVQNYLSVANNFVNEFMADNVYNLKLSEGCDESEAKQFAVSVKVISNTAISTYQLWLNEFKTENSGADLTAEQIATAKGYACESISDQIPQKVAVALTELGEMDMYGLIIGSIFYRIAGLLLPLVFVIMTANGLLAGQVDSGSMAYVLSTPTKRRTVTVTQMAYLICALLTMFLMLTAVSVMAVWIAGGNNFAINYAEILLFNLGAFLTTFAFAGYCFMCSAIFNTTKHSLSIGGGLTIFCLVCTILGLFGSSVVPSAMRIEAMNFFNYLSLITLFDTTAIMNGSISWLWEFGILFAVGVVTFIIGIFRFDKKDLPL